MPAMTNAQRQARRLALLNEAAIAAGWTGWRQYETAIITGRAKMTKLTPAQVRNYAASRVAASDQLRPHKDVLIDYDWPNSDEHFLWVANAPISELVDWAETTKENQDA